MTELRFVERNQKRILQQKVDFYETVNDGMRPPHPIRKQRWEDVPLEQEEICGTQK